MLERILVPLDGSARAEHALPVAARLARASGGTLILLRVYQVMPSEFVLSDYTAEEASAMAYLGRVAERPELAGIEIETITLAGAIALAILDAVLAYRADMIVMCSHGRFGLTRWALGSVAEKVVRYASVPVYVLREHTGPSSLQSDTEHPLRALVALDGSTFAEVALTPAAQVIQALAAPQPGALRLVQVVQPTPDFNEEDPEPFALLTRTGKGQEQQTLQEAQDYLRTVAERVRTETLDGLTLQVTWSAVIAEDVATALIQLAEQTAEPLRHFAEYGENTEENIHAKTALIVLASHGRGGLQRWVLGSIAGRVLEATSIPVLIVRPPQRQSLAGVQ